jgi:hypothetical protein
MSTELNCENLEVLLLQAQASLAGVSVVNFEKDTATDKDRIVVRAMPREVELPSHKQDSTPFAWRVPVEVTVHLMTRNTTTLDTLITAVQAANSGTPPASVVTAATSLFPSGLKIDDTDDGENDHSDNARTRTKIFNFIVKT